MSDAPLRDDVRLLGELLGNTLKEHVGVELYEKVENIRTLAKNARNTGDWQALVDVMSALPDTDLVAVARAFTHFLNYANIAEQHHRVRRRKSYESQPSQPGSMAELIPRLLNNGITTKDLSNAIINMKVELVLTAHPTEITRRTLLRKHNDISEILGILDQNDITDTTRAAQLSRLRRRILAGWHTDEIRRTRPTPVDEAKWGFATIESNLWQALPDYLRQLDQTLYQHTQTHLPLEATPIRFASWMGGDRDGNPNVTAKVTTEVLLLARWQAAELFLNDIIELREDLSIGNCNAALRQQVGDHPEPYRELLREVRQNLLNTRNWAEAQLQDNDFDTINNPIYQHNQQLLEPLLLINQSLLDTGMTSIARGSLANILRRVHCFGLTLLPLDVRQESTRHAEVIAQIVEHLDIAPSKGSYLEWSEADKQQFLVAELANKRPLISPQFPASAANQEVLDTFAVLAKQPPAALGAYIISMATHPSDVLAVKLLQKQAGCINPQRIVPLFETLSDLQGAANTLAQLLALPSYRDNINDQQEIMIGYSDSAKDAGFLAASWQQYQSQEDLTQVCKTHSVHLTLFHGRGGSASRGGGPAHDALLSQPPGTINGSIRVTEQGEMIQFKFGLHALAMHNLDLYSSGTLEATLAPSQPAPQKFRDAMQSLADVSVKEYRRIVHQDPRFVPYFRSVTPETELRRLALGSRPAKRKASGGVESLRAIPWVFAWTQMRLLLSAWLGTGHALNLALEQDKQALLQDMAKNWTFFSMLLGMQEMVLAKSEPRVARYYEQRLLEDASLSDLGEQLQQGLVQARGALERINGEALLTKLPMLKRSIEVRNPYIAPLHITQVELMRRLRKMDDGAEPLLEQALMVSIAGIAAGLRNTG